LLPVPELVRLHKEVEEPFNAGRFPFLPLRKPWLRPFFGRFLLDSLKGLVR